MKDDKHIVNKLKTSEQFTPVNMGISDDPEDQNMIVNILTNSLYTDKIAAVLREYGCNAADANTEAGKKNKPIKVHIPTIGEPYLSIRDEGGGMTEEQILKVFCRLGRSTKRNSNEVTGMLGIGSKAGFAYGDSFLVTSFTSGTRTVYNCFRDKRGMPQMAKMESGATTEPDGVEVKLAAKAKDIPYFMGKAQQVYGHFSPVPDGIKIKKATVLCADKNWRFVAGTGPTIAVMGNVGYEIDSEVVLAGHPSKKYSAIMDNRYGRSYSLELDFAIGELEIAANREGLQYHEHTKKVIRDRLAEIMDGLMENLKKQIAVAPTLWAARTILANMANVNVLSLRGSQINLTWQGKPLSLDFELPASTEEASVITYERSRWRTSMGKAFRTNVSPLRNLTLIIDDGSKYPRGRIAQFLDAQATANPTSSFHIAYFKFETPAIQKAYWAKNGLEGAPTKLLGSLPYTAPVGGIGRVKNTKHSQQCFTFTGCAAANSYGPLSRWWTQTTLNPTGTGVYVPLDRFQIAGAGVSLNYNEVESQLKALKTAGIFTGPLYGVKPLTVPKLGNGWVELKDWVESQMTKEMKQKLADYRSASAHAPLFKSKSYTDFYPKSPAAVYNETLQEMLSVTAKLEPFMKSMVAKYLNEPYAYIVDSKKLPAPSHDLENLAKTVLARYPMFNVVGRHVVANMLTPVAADYIKLVEESKK
jgi:hypothetical protein